MNCGKVKNVGYGGLLSVNGFLISDDVIMIFGVVVFFIDGMIYVDKIEVKGSGNFESKGGVIELEGVWEIFGGIVIKISNIEVVIEDKFKWIGGFSIEFIGGFFIVGDDFLGLGGGSICFDGIVVEVENDIKLSGSVVINVGGWGFFSINKVELKGFFIICGKDLGGWFNYVEDIDF